MPLADLIAMCIVRKSTLIEYGLRCIVVDDRSRSGEGRERERESERESDHSLLKFTY